MHKAQPPTLMMIISLFICPSICTQGEKQTSTQKVWGSSHDDNSNSLTDCITDKLLAPVGRTQRKVCKVGFNDRSIKYMFRQAKGRCKEKLEEHLEHNNAQDVWRGLKTISGYEQSEARGTAEGDAGHNDGPVSWICSIKDLILQHRGPSGNSTFTVPLQPLHIRLLSSHIRHFLMTVCLRVMSWSTGQSSWTRVSA